MKTLLFSDVKVTFTESVTVNRIVHRFFLYWAMDLNGFLKGD